MDNPAILNTHSRVCSIGIPIVNRGDLSEELQTTEAHQNQDQDDWVLVLGQDQLTPKAWYYAKELERFAVFTYFLSQDKSGFSQANIDKHRLHAIIVPKNLLRHWYLFLRVLWRLRPRHIEMFLGARPWTLFFYTLIARLAGIPILSWCRGSEIRDWVRHHPLRRLVNRFTLRSSKVILVRELYMERVFREHHIADHESLRLCHNSVPVPNDPPPTREPLVLFLNSFKVWRHPMLLVEAARLVLPRHPEARFQIVGDTSEFRHYNPTDDDVAEELRKRINALGLKEWVEILPFTDQPCEYFKRAAIFVLPADIVFCNFSLLEAMAMGVVPIVADVDGADLIVEDGVSGWRVAQNATEIAEKISILLRNRQLRETMAKAARETVADRFNSARTTQALFRLYSTELWKA